MRSSRPPSRTASTVPTAPAVHSRTSRRETSGSATPMPIRARPWTHVGESGAARGAGRSASGSGTWSTQRPRSPSSTRAGSSGRVPTATCRSGPAPSTRRPTWSPHCPRAAPLGLLRLALQILVDDLVTGSDRLDQKIGTLVGRGLDLDVQQGVDIPRMIGNEAVHPGQIEVDEDPAVVPAVRSAQPRRGADDREAEARELALRPAATVVPPWDQAAEREGDGRELARDDLPHHADDRGHPHHEGADHTPQLQA